VKNRPIKSENLRAEISFLRAWNLPGGENGDRRNECREAKKDSSLGVHYLG
jgi:hypothetical protein